LHYRQVCSKILGGEKDRFCIVNSWCCGRARPEKAAGRVAVAQRALFSTSETGVTMEAWNSARTSDFNIGRPCPKSG
jgi:hypothetical protein